MSKQISIIFALIALVLIAGVPIVSAENSVTPPSPVYFGGTVFIGESNLNVAPALNGVAGHDYFTKPNFTQPEFTKPDLTTIGWWASAAEIYTSSPTRVIDLGTSYNSLTITEKDFASYQGPWYLIGPDGMVANNEGPVFHVIYSHLLI